MQKAVFSASIRKPLYSSLDAPNYGRPVDPETVGLGS
jgi:hypothetical protein